VGNAGLARIATTYFDDIQVNAEGVFTGSFAILTHITGHFGSDGKLVVDVEQMKGEDLNHFSRRTADVNKQWSLVKDGLLSWTK
jgi:hypothetical protein